MSSAAQPPSWLLDQPASVLNALASFCSLGHPSQRALVKCSSSTGSSWLPAHLPLRPRSFDMGTSGPVPQRSHVLSLCPGRISQPTGLGPPAPTAQHPRPLDSALRSLVERKAERMRQVCTGPLLFDAGRPSQMCLRSPPSAVPFLPGPAANLLLSPPSVHPPSPSSHWPSPVSAPSAVLSTALPASPSPRPVPAPLQPHGSAASLDASWPALDTHCPAHPISVSFSISLGVLNFGGGSAAMGTVLCFAGNSQIPASPH